jgi:hypothetical protein
MRRTRHDPQIFFSPPFCFVEKQQTFHSSKLNGLRAIERVHSSLKFTVLTRVHSSRVWARMAENASTERSGLSKMLSRTSSIFSSFGGDTSKKEDPADDSQERFATPISLGASSSRADLIKPSSRPGARAAAKDRKDQTVDDVFVLPFSQAQYERLLSSSDTSAESLRDVLRSTLDAVYDAHSECRQVELTNYLFNYGYSD